MEIIADGMVHHVAEAFLYLQVFLTAIVAIFSFEDGAAIEAVVFVAIVFFHWVD